jgi:hypothetical protein
VETVDWKEIHVGDVVELREKRWNVTREDGTQLTVERDGSRPYTSTRPVGKVVRVLTANAAMDVAESIVVTRLGGRTESRRTGTGAWTCPLDYPEPGSLLAHLMVFHGEIPEPTPDSLRELEKIHGLRHDPVNRTEAYEPHVHDPNFLRSHI